MREFEVDVVIGGGGVAGCSAAIGAASAGARVLLIERSGYLGGEATHAGVGAFCGIYTCGAQPIKCAGGAADLILNKLERWGSTSMEWITSAEGNRNVQYKTEYLKMSLDELLQEEHVEVLLHTTIVNVDTAHDMVQSILCADDEGLFTVKAGAFVDATGDANLAHLAGASTLWGDSEGQVQAATLPFRLSRVDLNHDMSPAAVERAVKLGKESGIPYMTRERGFLQKMTGSDEVYVLLPSEIPNNLSAAELTRLEQTTRRQVFSYVEALRRFMPGMEHCELTMIGPSIGFRETRRISGRKKLTGEDVLRRASQEDSIGLAGWKPEIHRSADRAAQYVNVPDGKAFEIPLNCLISRDFSNLYACGRNISADSMAFAAVRVMGTCMVTGQAAGTAAALHALHAETSIRKIQEELLRQGALLSNT